jgi:large subunit ribosomal protein L24
MKVHKDDTVLVIAGKDKGKRGRVREVQPDKNKLVVEGINVMRKHTRGQRGARQAGIVEIEAAMDASKVMVVCGKCNKAVRVAHSFLADGSKARVCRNCNELLDRETERRWT